MTLSKKKNNAYNSKCNDKFPTITNDLRITQIKIDIKIRAKKFEGKTKGWKNNNLFSQEETCLRQEGKVILPPWEGERTISLVISLHRLQTQAQATTFWRLGHWSSLASTRWMISPRSSGSMVDHEADESRPSAIRSNSAESPTIRRPRPWSSSCSFSSLNDLENFRDLKTFLKDMAF